MGTSDSTIQHIHDTFNSLDSGWAVTHIEALSTLPHSNVLRVSVNDGKTLIFKNAGSEEFAPGLYKELVVNRDVLSKLPMKVGPRLLYNSGAAALPWLIFEDIKVSHQPISLSRPPAFRYIQKFVQALARVHAQSRQLDLEQLFSNVTGDVRVTDGAEYVPQLVDEFLHRCESDQYPPRTYELLRKIKDHIPQIGLFLSDSSTLLHGDAHYANALYSDDAQLIDWALAVIGPGEVDLCHALAMNLPRYYASEYEPAAIRNYVQTMSEFGIDQTEEEVLERYRKCLLLTVIIAVGMQSVVGMPESLSSYMFTNAVHSAIDHDSMMYLG